MENPLELSEPMPWETGQGNIVTRIVRTMVSAARPNRSALAFSMGTVRQALTFGLLLFVPWALLEGVIPYTHHLQFGERKIFLSTTTTNEAVVFDVLQAMGFSLLIHVTTMLALALPYVSLVRAFSVTHRTDIPLRVVFYRGWLIPFGATIVWLAQWLLPAQPPMAVLVVVQLVAVLPLLAFFMSLYATARLASGVGPFAALLVVGVPFTIMQLGQGLVLYLLQPWLPVPPVDLLAPK